MYCSVVSSRAYPLLPAAAHAQTYKQQRGRGETASGAEAASARGGKEREEKGTCCGDRDSHVATPGDGGLHRESTGPRDALTKPSPSSPAASIRNIPPAFPVTEQSPSRVAWCKCKNIVVSVGPMQHTTVLLAILTRSTRRRKTSATAAIAQNSYSKFVQLSPAPRIPQWQKLVHTCPKISSIFVDNFSSYPVRRGTHNAENRTTLR